MVERTSAEEEKWLDQIEKRFKGAAPGPNHEALRLVALARRGVEAEARVATLEVERDGLKIIYTEVDRVIPKVRELKAKVAELEVINCEQGENIDRMGKRIAELEAKLFKSTGSLQQPSKSVPNVTTGGCKDGLQLGLHR